MSMTDHAEYPIALINDRGEQVGRKLRREVDKMVDLYHSVFVVVVTPDERLALSVIPTRPELPNIYAGQLGATVASICRDGESIETAARRALSEEIHLDDAQLYFLGDIFSTLP